MTLYSYKEHTWLLHYYTNIIIVLLQAKHIIIMQLSEIISIDM